MFDSVTHTLKRIFGDANERELKRIRPLVERINTLEPKMKALSDADLGHQTVLFRERLAKGETVEDLLPEAFATVREAAVRTMGMRHYDSQMVGGIVIHQGRIAEMKTGEGKTLVATLPAYLNALPGKGVHLITVNDYLALRDAEWMMPIYSFLGLQVGTILSGDRNQATKRAAYAADITYGTNNEFGFDYLRDNMKFRLEDYVQRGHAYAIVDEVDSILIDEARTPLIISGPTQAPVDLYNVVDAVIPMLQRDIDFTLDEKGRNTTLTEDGIGRVEEKLHVDNLYDPRNIELLHHVTQSLKAHHLFKRDRDYVVREGEVVIVDENTGRLMHGRRWSDGLHQAVEAKEKVRVQEESQTYATITYQNYFRMYGKLSGMTGTAVTEAAEFMEIYKLPCVVIPTNRPIARKDHDDTVYLNQAGKYRAVLEEIKAAHERGQPVLVGTTSVEKSLRVSQLLEAEGISHEVLNAKQHEREAHIISQAGRSGAITISTNMAGRGTDIRLGGNAEEMARAEVGAEADEATFQAAVERHKAEVAAEAEKVRQAGGLHIVGTERHESRRVDNQLRGRSGRQGDPGSSRFFVALDDPLMKMFGSERIQQWMTMFGLQEDEAIEARVVTNSIENAQKKVEGYHFGVRKNLIEYDDVMNYQRKAVYDLRRRALEGKGLSQMVSEAVENVIGDIIDDYLAEGLAPQHWNIEGLRTNAERVFGIRWDETEDALRNEARRDVENRLRADAKEVIEAKRNELGESVFESAARMFILRLTDDLWKDHLLAIDRLRQGVSIRGYGQRNPLLEYKREAYQMFLMMTAARDEEVLVKLRTAQLQQAPAAALPEEDEGDEAVAPAFDLTPKPMPRMEAPQRPVAGDAARAFALAYGVQRNDPCPCGSGKKFKKCCGAKDADGADATA